MSEDVLVRAEHVSKKFCRSLKRSLWYGAIDIGGGLNPWNGSARRDDQMMVDPPLRKDEFWAVRDVSFELKRGECLGLIGHNGAGKSSLLKILNGLIPPDTGRITTRGRVGALIELNAGFNPVLTGRENIFNQAALLGFSKRETLAKFDAIVDFSEIGEFLDMPVQNYSSGMRVRLGFSVAAQLEPDVLLIDEVLAVGDVAFRFKCLNAIGELMKSAAVIFVSHTMPQIFRICTEVMVLNHGNVSFHGHDIGEGVGIYLSLFKNAEPTIAGSGEAQVVAAALESGTISVPMGETLRVAHASSVRLRASLHIDPSIERASIQFVLWNAEMLPVLDVMTEALTGFTVDVPESGNVEVTATLPRLELNAGKYSVSIMVNTPDFSRSLCRHDNAVYLQVEAAAASGAYVLAAGIWTATPVQ
jgi:lipopolysaccharide transport system ATP-binding protein